MMANYVSLEELKEQIEKTGTDDDALIQGLITAASQAIDNYCNRPDGFLALGEATARYYTGSGTAIQRIDDCVEVTLVEVKDSPTDDGYDEWGDGDWIAGRGDPRRPDFNRVPYQWLMVDPTGDEARFTSGKYTTRPGFRPLQDEGEEVHGAPTVRVTARWGHSATIPAAVKQACIIMASRWYKRGQSAWSDALASGELGQLVFVKKVDPDVAMILQAGRLVRPSIG